MAKETVEKNVLARFDALRDEASAKRTTSVDPETEAMNQLYSRMRNEDMYLVLAGRAVDDPVRQMTGIKIDGTWYEKGSLIPDSELDKLDEETFVRWARQRFFIPKAIFEKRQRGQQLFNAQEKIEPLAVAVGHREQDKHRAVAAVAAAEAQLAQARGLVGQAEADLGHAQEALDQALKAIGF